MNEPSIAAPIDISKLPKGIAPPRRDPTSVRLERPRPAAPGEPLVCGEYGPRFVGYAPTPEPTLLQRATPWILGLVVGVAALTIEHLTGSF